MSTCLKDIFGSIPVVDYRYQLQDLSRPTACCLQVQLNCFVKKYLAARQTDRNTVHHCIHLTNYASEIDLISSLLLVLSFTVN